MMRWCENSLEKKQKKKKSNQHADFPSGHPPEYYPRQKLLNFIDRTGYGAVSFVWPITKDTNIQTTLKPTQPTTTKTTTTDPNTHINNTTNTLLVCNLHQLTLQTTTTTTTAQSSMLNAWLKTSNRSLTGRTVRTHFTTG